MKPGPDAPVSSFHLPAGNTAADTQQHLGRRRFRSLNAQQTEDFFRICRMAVLIRTGRHPAAGRYNPAQYEGHRSES
jgi:hypothetical protein